MKILIISIPGIGNTILTIPMLRALRKEWPKARIDLLVGIKDSARMMENCPYTDNIYFLNKKIQRGFFKNIFLAHLLWKQKYDVSLTTFPASQPHYNFFAKFIINAKTKITHSYRGNFISFQDKRVPIQEVHDIEQNLLLLSALGLNPNKSKPKLWLTETEKEWAKNFLSRFKEKTFVGLHPGTSIGRKMERKRWPLKNFVEISNKILKNKNARIFVFLGPYDISLKKMQRMVKNERLTIIQEKDIRKVSALISKCSYFVSNDSGLMNISAALDIPTVGVFISTDYRRTAPYGKNNLVARNGETYRYFRQSMEELKGEKTNWESKKIPKVSVDEVWKQIRSLSK